MRFQCCFLKAYILMIPKRDPSLYYVHHARVYELLKIRTVRYATLFSPNCNCLTRFIQLSVYLCFNPANGGNTKHRRLMH